MTHVPTVVEVEETRSGRFINTMRDGRHTLTADKYPAQRTLTPEIRILSSLV
jgi:hypothetical protein